MSIWADVPIKKETDMLNLRLFLLYLQPELKQFIYFEYEKTTGNLGVGPDSHGNVGTANH